MDESFSTSMKKQQRIRQRIKQQQIQRPHISEAQQHVVEAQRQAQRRHAIEVQRRYVGDYIARETSTHTHLTRALTHGQPLITHRPDDDNLDRVEWDLSRIWHDLTDEKRKIKLTPNNHVRDDLIPKWRRTEVVLYDAPDLQRGQMIHVNPHQQTDWLTAIVKEPPPHVIVVHPDQWLSARDELESRGYVVLNRDAEYTRPGR